VKWGPRKNGIDIAKGLWAEIYCTQYLVHLNVVWMYSKVTNEDGKTISQIDAIEKKA